MGAYLAWFMLLALFSSVEMVQVNVVQGTLRGENLTTIVGDTTYYSFKAIPYAAPPVGKLRFKAPEPATSWTGVRNATSYGSVCPQKDIFTGVVREGSEDCLFLNVFTPNLNPKTLLPVMLFIHGGGFQSGAGSDYGPDFLMKYNVLLVTINYRLGALGFLSLGTEEVPGNAGLKDQVAALKWVKENIEYFGGDPDNVTIIGQSAGGASVTYHMVSSMSKGLFKRGIALSGTMLCDFLTEYKPVKRSFRLGELTGVHTNDTTVLLNHLQNLTADNFYNTNCTLLLSEPVYDVILHGSQFPPVIENYYNNSNTFLSENALEILKNGNNISEIDLMVGYVSQEAAFLIDQMNSTLIEIYGSYPEMFVPSQMYFKNTPSLNLDLAEMIQEYYFGDAILDVDIIDKFVTYTSDSGIVRDVIRFMNLLPTKPKNTSRYMYEFSMSSGLNYYGNQANKFGYYGDVSHVDDLLYLFSTAFLNTTMLEENSTELSLINQFCTLVTNFAKFGNPTPDDCSLINTTWPQYDKPNKRYLDIGNTMTVKKDPKPNMMKFWQSAFEYAGSDFY